MPAAAVIPAPRAYIKVVAVKKLVVELWHDTLVVRKDRTSGVVPSSPCGSTAGRRLL